MNDPNEPPERTIPRCASCRRTDVKARDVCPKADALECHETASVNVVLREEPPSASAARAKAARLTGSAAVAMHCADAYQDEATHAPKVEGR